MIIDKSFAIQLMVQKNLYNVNLLQKLLYDGFCGYANMTNNELLEEYNNQAEIKVSDII